MLWRLTLILVAAIYLAMIVLSDSEPSNPGDPMTDTMAAAEAEGVLGTGAEPAPMSLDGIELETGEVLQVDRVIRPSDVVTGGDGGAAGPDAAPRTDPESDATTLDPAAPETAADAAAPAAPSGSADTTAGATDSVAGTGATPALPALVYVTGTRVNLRAGPSTDTDIIAALDLGTEARVLSADTDGWYQIEIAGGLQGYMSTDFLSVDRP